MENSNPVSRPGFWESIGKYAIFALVFALPLIFLPFYSNPLEIHKEVLSIVLLLVGALAFLIIVLEKRNFSYPRSWISLGILMMLASAGISTIFSYSPKSFHNGFVSPDSFVSFLIYALVFFLGFYFVKDKDIPKLGKFFLGSMLLVGVFGFLQAFGKFIIPFAGFKNAAFNPLGSFEFLGMFMAASLALLLSADKTFLKKKPVSIALAVIFAIGVLLAQSAYLWLGLAIFMFILGGIRFSRGKSIDILLGGAAIALLLFFISGHLPKIFNSPLEVRPNISASLEVAKDSLRWMKIPFGFGPGNFSEAFMLHKPDGINQSAFWNAPFGNGFNFILTLLITQGVIGVLAFLFLIFALARSSFEERDEYGDMLLGLVIFFVVQWFIFPMSFVQFVLLFLGLGILSSRKKEVEFSGVSRGKTFGIFSLIVIIAASIASLLFFVGEKYVSAAYFEKGIGAANSGNAEESLKNIGKAISLDPNRDIYWRFQSQAFLTQASNLIAKQKAELASSVQASIQNSVQSAKKAIEINPKEIANWNNMGMVYEKLIGGVDGSTANAVESFTKASELDPTNAFYVMEIGRVYLESGKEKYPEAQKWLQKSIEMRGDFVDAKLLLAQLYINSGNVDKGVKEVEEIKSQNPYDLNISFQLGLLYYQNSQTDKAQAEFERILGINGDYSNAKYFLGLIYDRKGQRDKAIEQFKRLVELNPDNQEVKKILDNLNSGKAALTGISTGQNPSSIVPAASTPGQ